MDNLILQDLILEVYADRSPLLKDIDLCFSKIKKDNNNLDSKKELVTAISKFTKIDKVFFSLKKDWENASVLPYYKNNLPSITEFINNTEKDDKTTPKTIQEPSTYINKIYIIIGTELLNVLSPRELTSVLLHEIGHVYYYTSNYPLIITGLIRFLYSMGITKTILFGIFGSSIFNPISILITVVIFITSRTITFFDHINESNSDLFAVRYGYGEELASVIKKIKNKEDEIYDKKSIFKKTYELIHHILIPSSHPRNSNRLCDIIEKMKEDYKNMYPKLKNELEIVYGDLKCDSIITKTGKIFY